MINPHWFNLMAADTVLRIGARSVFFCAAQIFNHRCADGQHYWGVGVLQIGHRHLFYVGHSGVSILFVGRTS